MIHRRTLDRVVRASVLVLAGLWVYSPVYHGGWLWDDHSIIFQNADVHSGSLAGLVKLWVNPDGLDYFPLSYSAFWLQSLVFGAQPTGYHVTSIMLHIASGLLLWTLLAKLNIPGAWATALVFTVHPACVESVAWVSETKNTLSLALFLASCIFWVGQDDEEPGPTRQRLYRLSLAFFLLAMFAKTSVVAMPVLTLLYAWWKRGSITMQDAARAAPLFLISIVLGIVTMQYQAGRAINGQEMHVGGFDSRIAMAGMAILFYLATIIWPVHLLPIYPRWDVDPPRAWQLLPWLLIGAAGWWLWKNRETPWGRNAILGFGFFLLMIAPVLGFVDISYMQIAWVADHFLYLPMIGPLALLTASVTTWLGTRAKGERIVFGALAAGAVLFLGMNASVYAVNWTDSDRLWEYTLAHNYDAWPAHANLGYSKLKKGDIDAACDHFRHAARLRPDVCRMNTELGFALVSQGRIDESLEFFQNAVQAAPDSLEARKDLADAYSHAGRHAEARTVYEELLKLLPSNPLVLSSYGDVLFKLGEKDNAIAQFNRALKLDPSLLEAQEGLKVALGETDKQPPTAPSPTTPAR